MSKFARFLDIARQDGLTKAVKRGFRKLTGIKDREDEINALYFFLNNGFDITKFPKATGNLRKLQEADALLLAIVDKVCRKNDIEYWLDAGTLLGAVRHKGFIPWDDDLDICIFRDDFYNAINIFNEELNQFGIEVDVDTINPGWRLGIGYRTAETGVWLDIFPVDFAKTDVNNQKDIAELQEKCKKYYNKWCYNKNNWKLEDADAQRVKIVNSICTKQEANTILYTVETFGGMILDITSALPTRDVQFEDFMFKAPNDADYYLRKKYGNTYMEFPRWGVNHHESEHGLIQDWAENNGVNMEEVISYLNSVLQNYN